MSWTLGQAIAIDGEKFMTEIYEMEWGYMIFTFLIHKTILKWKTNISNM